MAIKNTNQQLRVEGLLQVLIILICLLRNLRSLLPIKKVEQVVETITVESPVGLLVAVIKRSFAL